MRKEIYRISPDEELTDAKLSQFIARHATESTFRYKQLQDAYETDFPIFHEKTKPEWKPDNRIAVNFAKYIEFLDQYNDQDDNNAELSKICSIYGKGYEMYYNDEDGNVGIIYLDPTEAFMIYDDSVLKRERYFVRLYRDEDNVLHGSVSDQEKVRWFTIKGKIVWNEQEQLHYFNGVPATEYRENKECQGIFEPVMSIINAFNKAISEKANDVDYFADAYLKIIGTLLDEDELKHIRSDRVINFDGDGESVIVDFLQKPNGDTTQENLLDRLQNLIFLIAMVANISDENFGTSSGIAMAYKLQGMSNLRKTKERKFTSGMNRRYKLIFSNPGNAMKKDDWVKLHYKFTPNVPANLLEESQIAQNLSGVVSQETQLGVLSVVDNPKTEIERIDKEEEKPRDVVMQQMFGDKTDEQ